MGNRHKTEWGAKEIQPMTKNPHERERNSGLGPGWRGSQAAAGKAHHWLN